jgi:hypothetical protein
MSNLVGQRSRGAVLPPPRVSIAVREAVLAQGARATATRLGLSDATTSRIAGRLPCHRASIELAAQRLGIELRPHFPERSLSGKGDEEVIR